MYYKSGYSLAVVLLSVLYFINILFSLIIFIQKRQTAGKMSWMIIFFIFPFFGHIIFWIFGQKYNNRVTFKKYFSKPTFKYEEFIPRKDNILSKQSNISKRGIYKCDIKVYKFGYLGYKDLFEDLEKAKKFIHLQYYIIKSGEIFDQFKDILLRKAKEGVEVKFIVDDFGRWAVPWHEIKFLEENGIIVKRFGKVRFPFLGSSNNYRMHRKVAIIDGKIVHNGGINIADEYACLNKKYGMWLDCQIRITGKSVRSYSLLFIDDWYTVSKEKLEIKKYLCEDDIGKSSMVLIEDSPEIFETIIQNSLINMIIHAKKEIILTTPYLILTPELFSAIKIASLSGVKVKIIIPGLADKKSVMIATNFFAKSLVKYGVEIYKVKNMMMHSKIGMFDNEYSYLGTANLDVRSSYSQWEVIQILKGAVVVDIKKVLDYYLELSEKLSEKDLHKNIIIYKISEIYINLCYPNM